MFEDTDENKLEYTPLHEEFIKLSENAMEAYIKEQLGLAQEDIDAFYLALQEPNKLKVLEASNKDTVDHLYTMLDFAKFKQQMLDAKKGAPKNEDTSAEVQREIKDKQSWTWDEYQTVLNEELDTKTSLWKSKLKQTKFKDNAKLCVYQKPQKGKVDLLRVECQFIGVDPHKLWTYITNPPPTTLLKELKVIGSEGEHQIDIYFQVKVPLMTTRDLVLRCQRFPLTDDSYYLTTQTITHPDYPPRKGIIRMFSYLGAYIRPDPAVPGNYLYTEISNFDMKGSMPVKLLNMSLASEASKEMKNLSKYM